MTIARERYALYAVTDRVRAHTAEELLAQAAAVIRGGAQIVQLREKELPFGEFLEEARQFVALCRELGAVSIIVYSQSYGFMQLYTAPRQMGFIAASAILIGGASVSRARISHVIIGAFLFQGVLTLGMPVANVLVPQSTISETMRILISNGIILYALTKAGGGSRA